MSGARDRLRRRISSRFAGPSRGRRTTDPATLVVLLDGEPAGARRLLDSALAQEGASVEILVVVLAQPLLEAARERAAEDSRVVVVESVGESRGRARRRAVARSRGPAVLVLVPGAELVPGALARLLARRAETRSPVVVGEVVGGVQAGAGRTGPGGDLDAHPEVARLPVLARLLVERTLLGAKESLVDDPDGSVTALGVLSGGFVLEPTACLRDVRPGASRALFRVSPWPGLGALLDAVEAGDGMLTAHPAALAERSRGLLARELLELAEAAEDADDDAWRRYVETLLARVDRADLKALPVEPRVLLWLACAGVRADVVRFVAARRLAKGALPTHVVERGGSVRVRAALAGPTLLAERAPAYLLDLPDSQLALRARLSRLRVDGEHLELVVQTGISLLDQSDPDGVRASVTLVSGERRLPGDVVVCADPDVTRWMAERGQDHDAGSLVVRAPLADLGDDGWRLELDLEVAGVRRRGVIGDLDPRGSAERAFLVDDPVTGRDVVELSVPGPHHRGAQ